MCIRVSVCVPLVFVCVCGFVSALFLFVVMSVSVSGSLRSSRLCSLRFHFRFVSVVVGVLVSFRVVSFLFCLVFWCSGWTQRTFVTAVGEFSGFSNFGVLQSWPPGSTVKMATREKA